MPHLHRRRLLLAGGAALTLAGGDRIGRVRQVVTDGRGQIQQLLVRVDGEEAMLPASNFQASGTALVSAMGETQIKQVAEQQEATRARVACTSASTGCRSRCSPPTSRVSRVKAPSTWKATTARTTRASTTRATHTIHSTLRP